MKNPTGYPSNISHLVSMSNLKLVRLKSHDWHVLMQQLLLVTIRATLPKLFCSSITRLCLFFNEICAKVVDHKRLNKIQDDIVLVFCKLEMYFPHTLIFDIMVHLMVYLI